MSVSYPMLVYIGNCTVVTCSCMNPMGVWPGAWVVNIAVCAYTLKKVIPLSYYFV